MFHLSFPVRDLERSRSFYVEVLGGRVGRVTQEWLDVIVWGHQLTLQHRPDEVLPADAQGSRHFGVTLEWEMWEQEAARLKAANATLLAAPSISKVGTPHEQAKLYLADPDGYVIEIKAYRDADAVFGRE